MRAESECRSTRSPAPDVRREDRVRCGTSDLYYTNRMLSAFLTSVVELIVKTSTDLPPDVRAAMRSAMGAEQPGTQSTQALRIIAQNIDQAADGQGAICQDTGMPTFEVHVPRGSDQIWMRQQIR